jgi:hypothetical protein
VEEAGLTTAEEVMEILEAFDMAGTLRGALTWCDHKTVGIGSPVRVALPNALVNSGLHIRQPRSTHPTATCAVDPSTTVKSSRS